MIRKLRAAGSPPLPPLFGVVKEQAADKAGEAKLGVAEFAADHFCAPLFLDESHRIFELLGGRRLDYLTVLRRPLTFLRRSYAAHMRARTDGVPSRPGGESQLLGGLLVVAPGGEVVYTYHEDIFSPLPVEDIEAALYRLAAINKS